MFYASLVTSSELFLNYIFRIVYGVHVEAPGTVMHIVTV